MNIWVDADACPAVIKDILFRVADRREITVTLVANKLMRTPPSRFIKAIQVPSGFDVADQEIVRLTQPGDLVITADIPLAADVLEKGGDALNPRGEFYTKDNIAQMLGMRSFMDELRASGVDTGGPAPFSQNDRQMFANQLDKHLTALVRRQNAARPPKVE
ncbi:MAG TPA: YaiI/YqxD family protein [Burkholderiaceae bacterium]